MFNDVSHAYSIEDLRRMARKRLPRIIFDFFDGGAEDELTLRGNRAAFERIRFSPHPLVDVSAISTATTLLRGPANFPIAVAPTGATGFGRPHADIATARAAASFGIPFTLSTSATASIETIANKAPGRLWFQAYVLRNKEFLQKLIERAQAADYEALVITVDLPVGGKRERDFRNDFHLPFHFTPRNFLDFARCPGWCLRLLQHGMPVMGNLTGLAAEATSASGIASSVGRNYDPSFDWEQLKAIRDNWPRKLIIKGILRVDDAQRAADMGCDALIVSNHGGRQLDGAVASLDALPAIARAVGDRMAVLLDGGVRRGSDIIKARALGAQGVMVGRATLFGACAGGENGARRALEILTDELTRSMRLCGLRRIDEINPDILAHHAAQPGAND